MKGSSIASKRRKTTPPSLSPSGNAAAKAARISSPLSYRTPLRSVRARTSNAAEQNMKLPDAGGRDDDQIYYPCDDDADEMYEEDDIGGAGGHFVVSKYFETCVKVFCIHTEPNFSLPWQRKRQFASTSSGFVIADRRILTNAHRYGMPAKAFYLYVRSSICTHISLFVRTRIDHTHRGVRELITCASLWWWWWWLMCV